MEFTVLFLVFAVAMLAAWRGPRAWALALFAATLATCIVIYLHHATDVLALSF